MKRGKAKSSKITPQHRAGTEVIEKLLSSLGKNVILSRFVFCPIAEYGGNLHRQEVKNFRNPRNVILFRGERKLVTLAKCGSSISHALRRSF